MASNETPTVALPQGIEIFTAGEHITDAGEPITFTEKDVADIAAGYDAQLHEAPITVGHPAHDKPAYGWVKGIAAAGVSLLLGGTQVEPQFAEMVRTGRFKKRSAAFYPPQHPANPRPGHWYLRHVAFLGAAPPAVKGLKEIPAFSEKSTSEGCVCFTEPITKKESTMPDQNTTPPTAAAPGPDAQAQAAQLQQRIDEQQRQIQTLTAERDAALAAQKAAEDQLAAISKAEEQKRQDELTQFAESLVKEGKIIPAEKMTTLLNLQTAAAAKPVQFSEGDVTRTVHPLETLKQQLQALPRKVVAFGEWQPASGKVPASTPDKMSAGELNARAEQYQKQHNVNFMEALSKVSTGTTFTK